MFRIIIFLLFATMLVSCSNQTDDGGAAEQKIAFEKFLGKFDALQLPLNFTPGRMHLDHYQKLDSTDRYFTKYKENEVLYAFGILPDTSTSFKVIWFEPADDYYPVLATFNKNGIKIKQENIGVGGCGVDCGFNCTETIAIQKDMSIYSVDSVKSTPCDSNGNKIEKATERYLRYKVGKITRNGRIKMSAVLQKSIN